MLNEAQIKDLVDKALAGGASQEELRVLTDALKDDPDYAVTEQVTTYLSTQPATHTLPSQERISNMADEILAADKLAGMSAVPERSQVRVIALWKKLAVAAVILAAAITTFYLWPNNKKPFKGVMGPQAPIAGDINPGNNKARLILASGATILLDTLVSGIIPVQGSTQVAKCEDGQLSYTTAEGVPVANGITTALYNTVVVPRGGQYKLILADGTEVWLNAASSLHFPVAFTGNERVVELDGEGYFEVAKDAARPFTVRTKRADVKVLGTHFNVCAYDGEDWKTTLLEGKVSARRNTAEATLTPGNQAILAVNGETFRIVPNADLDEAIAWKEGFFQFNDASVASIMQQVSRWYDVDIEYKDTATRAQFNGRINRNIRLSGIVNALQQGGIKCSIDNNRLLVYP
jgi:hypothetical protein